jgi:hypothetical protein
MRHVRSSAAGLPLLRGGGGTGGDADRADKADSADKAERGTRRWVGYVGGGTICLAVLAAPAQAQVPAQADLITPQDAAKIRAEIQSEEQKIHALEQQLHVQSLRLNDQQNLLDAELSKLRATGTSTPATAASSAAPVNPSATPSSEPAPSNEAATAPAATTPAADQAAPVSGPSPQQRDTKAVLQTAHELSNTGGVLTPRGQFVIDPSFEYDYWNENQVTVSGFTIVPGITFGDINVNRVQANYLTEALTLRYGLTNRLEVNARVPVVYAYGTTTTQPLGSNAQIYSPSASNFNLGDIQFGGSYQINTGANGWPIFLGNLLFKTTTGVSPFSVPIYTTNDPDGGLYIAGIQKKLPTGTGFYSLEPNVTMLIPTSPGVLFANILYGVSFSRNVEIANRAGGESTEATVRPGDFISATFGVGFALNDKTSLTFSYQQEHVWQTTENGANIAGSSFDFGTFNFGVGLTVAKNMSVNIGAGIGVGPNNPVAKILIEVPIRFSL